MYTIRELNSDDFLNLKQLYAVCFGITLSERTFREKFFNGGQECTISMLAMDSDGQAAAFYGVFISELMYDDQTYFVAQSGSTMTHPKHQKRGLFTQLAMATFDACKKKSIALIFGFPNAQSFHGFAHKLNWKFEGNMRRWDLKTGGLPCCEISSKSSWLQFVYRFFTHYVIRTRFELPPTKVSRTLESHNARGYLRRTKQQWDSLLAQRGTYHIYFENWELLIKLEGHLIIGAIGFHENPNTQTLVHSIKRLARKLGCSKAVLSFSPNHWLSPILESQTPSREGLPIGYLNLTSSIDLSQVAFCYSDFDTF